MKVLLGIDDASFRALDRTIERALGAGDELTVAVLDVPDAEATPDAVESEVRERLGEVDLRATVRRLEGDPGSRLVEVAEAEGFDEIVLDGRERSPMGKIRVGEVAEFVLANARLTVTLVR